MIRRNAERLVAEAMADTPVVLIHGPRQCGKSTLAQAVCPDLCAGNYVTLDDPIAWSLAKTDPAAFLAAYPPPVVIDEIQRAPELFLPIKLHVDRHRSPGMFLLTGSANVLSLPKLADSLAGRIEIVDLYPFTQAELQGGGSGFLPWLFSGEPLPRSQPAPPCDLLDLLARGGFPEPSLRASAPRRAAWFASYVKTLLDRDVRDLANIEALTQMPRLLNLLATRAGTVLNVASLATDVALPYTTLRRYLGLLESIFLLQTVPAWSSSAGKTFTKAPKAYLVDTGLLCHLANLDAAVLSRDRDRLAHVLENFVAMELRKQAAYSDLKPWLLHLRTVRQLEVDFVLEARGGRIAGVEVKAADTLRPQDASGLRYLRELTEDRFAQGVVLYTGSEIKPLDDRIVAAPLSLLWSMPDAA